MINEQKLREELGKILERPAFRGLYTYSREPLIDAVVEAVKKTLPKPKRKTSGKKRESN